MCCFSRKTSLLNAWVGVGADLEVLARLREQEGNGNMPRLFLWVTGPSRTGDIEQTIQLGAFGPRRLHIVLVDDTEENK